MEIPRVTLPTRERLQALTAHARQHKWLRPGYIAFAAYVLFVLHSAWVSEDAYITLRVLDNFFHGYGLRWNISERVQVYTHPLWMLLHIPLNVIFSNLFLSNVILSVVCMGGAVYLTLATVKKPLLVTLCCLYLPLLASKALRDYSTSGLENPLSDLLFAAFGYVLLKRYDHPKFWLYLSLATSLSLLNRLDTIILYAPTLTWLAYNRTRDINWKHAALGTLPLLLWFAFSLFYYGFLFPNTKYAKLDTALAAFRYVRHGIAYMRYTMIMDPVTALATLVAFGCLIMALMKTPPVLYRLNHLPTCIAIGVCWYVFYVIYIGGDYMVGRFWALPAFIGVWLLYVFLPDNLNPKIFYSLAVFLFVIGTPFPIANSLRKHCPACYMNPHPMIDAKMMFSGNFLFPATGGINTDAHHKFVGWAEALSKKAPGHVEKAHFIGMLGYYSGPGNVLIDELALADPLLARLPVTREDGFFTGHFKRAIPDGYIYAVKTGSTEKMDPSLALYYEKLRLITSGDLLDPARLKTIIAFNLGTYEHWKRDYLTCSVW